MRTPERVGHLPPGDRGHLLRMRDVDQSLVLSILARADEFSRDQATWPSHPRKIVILAFFEPSTRTLIGFQSAAARSGAVSVVLDCRRVIAQDVPEESLEDTLRVVANYGDVLVLRHMDSGAADLAAVVSPIPVINAGNGREEHPTQALIDLFAIRKAAGSLEGLTVGIAGDLRGSRAAHSLLYALSLFRPSEIRLMYPSSRSPAPGLLEALGLPVTKTEDGLELEGLDVLYMAGLPKGEGSDTSGEKVRAQFRLTLQSAQRLPRHALVLCPLPRIDEIDRSVDELPIARYFQQSSDGLYVRMAVLEYALTWFGPSSRASRAVARRLVGP